MRFAELLSLGISVQQLSELFDIPRRTIAEWAKDSSFPKSIRVESNNQKFYRFSDAAQYCLNHYKKIAIDPNRGKSAAELALIEARARLVTLRADQEEGRLLPLELILPLLVKQSLAVRQAFDGAPGRWAPRLAEMSDPHDIAEFLASEINNAIAELPQNI